MAIKVHQANGKVKALVLQSFRIAGGVANKGDIIEMNHFDFNYGKGCGNVIEAPVVEEKIEKNVDVDQEEKPKEKSKRNK